MAKERKYTFKTADGKKVTIKTKMKMFSVNGIRRFQKFPLPSCKPGMIIYRDKNNIGVMDRNYGIKDYTLTEFRKLVETGKKCKGLITGFAT